MTKLAPYRSRRFAAALLGLLALWFQTVALTVSPAAAQQMHGSAGGGLVICTPDGLEIIDAGDGGGRTPPDHQLCVCCVLGGCGGLCPPRVGGSILLTGQWQPAFEPVSQDQILLERAAKTSKHPRAPPIVT